MSSASSLTLFPLSRRIALGARLFVEKVLLRRKLDQLTRTLGGHIFFETLVAAAHLDLFSLLGQQGPMTRAEMAQKLGVADKPLRIVLLGCVALGLLRKSGDRYRNDRLADMLLTRQAPRSILPIIEWQHAINYRAMYHFDEAIQANRNVGLKIFQGTENTLYGRLTHHPELEMVFQKAMQSISVQANEMLAQFVDFSGVQHLVDVGGGNGSNIIRLARRYPQLKASVFDAPSVCEIARAHIDREGLADRLGAVPGDCFRDPFPAGVDCILFCHFFTIWSEERNQELLRKAHAALPEGGAAIIFNMMQDDDESGPLTSAMGSPYFLTLATGEGMLYTWSEYEAWMRAAGFRRVVRRAFARNHGAIIGLK
jgi:cyclopropane fatty-acyl-phospholipid synthase-like methyltransferase